MGFFDYIKKLSGSRSTGQSETQSPEIPGAFYFHEDYYCQIEYLPKENSAQAIGMAEEIKELSQKSFDGNGWADCQVRDNARVTTKSKNYLLGDLENFLVSQNFSAYPAVTTGYGSRVVICENTKAFRKKSISICVDYDGEIIRNVWHNFSPAKADHDEYKDLLLKMALAFDFILADWWKLTVVDISDSLEIEKYFTIEV